MADNVAVTAGSGTTIATEDRSSVHFQRVVDTGGDSIATGRVNVTTTSGEVVAARSRRRSLDVLALTANTADVDIGPSGVASGSGFPLIAGASTEVKFAGSLHADTSTGTQVVAYIEIYD